MSHKDLYEMYPEHVDGYEQPKVGLSATNALLCVADIERELHPTCGTTPAGGKCFVHEQKDICATVYSKTRARVFYNRRNGFEGREQIPCFYDNEKRLDT